MLARALRGLAAATVLVVAVSSTADAQAAAASRFGVNAGVSMPMGDFGDAANMGFVIGGHWQMDMGEKLKLRINADYTRHGFSDDVSALFGDGNWTQFGAVANVILPMPSESAMGFYFLGGLGFYSSSADVSGAESESNMAFNVGAGMGKGRWFVEARYLSIMADPDAVNALPIVFGLRF